MLRHDWRNYFLPEQTMTALKEFMTEREIPVAHMAQIAGVTEKTIYNWTSGFKKTPLSVQLMIKAINAELISLEWFSEQAKATKGEQ
jgi:predicted transcriptional regulator